VNNDHDSRGGKAKVQYDSEIKYSFLTLEWAQRIINQFL
jgi:hypothetical protein